MAKAIYEVEHRVGHSNVLCRGVKLGQFYSAELAETVVRLLNSAPRPKLKDYDDAVDPR